MPSCEIYGDSFAVRLTYNLSQDIAGNYSVVRITKVEMKSLKFSSTVECWIKGSITINGATAVTMELTNTTACAVTMGPNYNGGGEGNGWFSGFSTTNITIGHGEDGSGSMAIAAKIAVYRTTQSVMDPGSWYRSTVSLPQIPRVSGISAGGVVLGQEMTIRLSRASSAFSDTVSWRCGSLSGTLAEQTTASELKWTPAVDLAAQAPESTAVPIVLTTQTFVGGSQVGSREIMVSCTVPDSVVPTVSAEVTDRMGYAETYGGYVQTQSQARVATTAEGVYGSSIRSIAVGCGSLTGSGADVSFALADSGEIPITVTVTDSRGRTASFSTSINVLSYRKPIVSVAQAYRCDSEGNPQPDGTWLRVVFDGSVTALNGNSATYRGLCRVHGGEGERSVLLADYTGKTTVTGGSFLLTAGLDSGYDCFVTAQDDFCTTEGRGAFVSVAFALLDFDRANKAVGIGMRAKNPGQVSIGLDVNLEEHRIGNLLDPEENQDAATKGYAERYAARTVQESEDKCVKYDDCLTLEEIAASTDLSGKMPQASGVKELLDKVTVKDLGFNINGDVIGDNWISCFLVGNVAFIAANVVLKTGTNNTAIIGIPGYVFTRTVNFVAGSNNSQVGEGYVLPGEPYVRANFKTPGGNYCFCLVAPVQKQ